MPLFAENTCFISLINEYKLLQIVLKYHSGGGKKFTDFDPGKITALCVFHKRKKGPQLDPEIFVGEV